MYLARMYAQHRAAGRAACADSFVDDIFANAQEMNERFGKPDAPNACAAGICEHGSEEP